MKHHPIQFGACENTASSKQHASRLSLERFSSANHPRPQIPEIRAVFSRAETPPTNDEVPLHAALGDAATDGGTAGECRLFTVHDVAALLQVPVSWVYGRMRKRSPSHLPGYRLGKYWRFDEREVMQWVRRQSGGQHGA
jgi:excisionase family DNA binding protein